MVWLCHSDVYIFQYHQKAHIVLTLM